jgi:hypothetical protein
MRPTGETCGKTTLITSVAMGRRVHRYREGFQEFGRVQASPRRPMRASWSAMIGRYSSGPTSALRGESRWGSLAQAAVSIPVSIDPGTGQYLTPGIPADRAVCQRIAEMASDSRRAVVGLISVRSVVDAPLPPASLASANASTPLRPTAADNAEVADGRGFAPGADLRPSEFSA